jgi:hypothetical protein
MMKDMLSRKKCLKQEYKVKELVHRPFKFLYYVAPHVALLYHALWKVRLAELPVL